jgi:alkylation response protein AidB-like acyl-CoA dehydrogenase
VSVTPSTIHRELPDEDARDLLALTCELADAELAPHADEAEAAGRFPRETFRTLGRAGLLGLAYPESVGGGGVPYAVYLQVLEELARRWGTVALGVSVHTLACHPLATAGTDAQRERWLPEMLAGDLLGAYALSEPQSGSDAAALQTRARRDGDDYVLDGIKAWTTHGGQADFYSMFVRTSDDRRGGVSCLLVPAGTEGLVPQPPERKMGFRASPTAQLVLEGARVPAERLIGPEGSGMSLAMSALTGGRLGIAAVAVGIAQAALDQAVAWANERVQFGRTVGGFQGVQFLLADMATQVAAARELCLAAARRRDAGVDVLAPAGMAKLFATDAAMRVTTDAIQVMGGYGYVADFPVERLFREAKALQIVEGTNQVQRMVVGRSLTRPGPA